MNQILSVEPPKPKKEKKPMNTYGNSSGGGTIEIEKIIKFFAITMIVFGVMMIGSASYCMYQGSKTGNTQAKPVISVQEISETQLQVEISHNSPLQEVTYNWNNEEPTELDASGKKNITQTIEIPTGDNTLNIYAIDQNGNETNYSRQYTRQGDITIDDFVVEGNNIRITATGKNQLSYMTYRWDNDDEQRIDINSMSTEQLVEIPMGQHTLTVSVVDINNTTQTKKQEVMGVMKPTVEITTDGSSNFVIKASDEQGITRIEVTIDQDENQKYLINLEQVYPSVEDRKEFEYGKFQLHDGENTIEVTVYNESGVSETQKAKAVK